MKFYILIFNMVFDTLFYVMRILYQTFIQLSEPLAALEGLV